jgi:hypothetical protein
MSSDVALCFGTAAGFGDQPACDAEMAFCTRQQQRGVAAPVALRCRFAASLANQPAHDIQVAAIARVQQRRAAASLTLRVDAAASMCHKPLHRFQNANGARAVQLGRATLVPAQGSQLKRRRLCHFVKVISGLWEGFCLFFFLYLPLQTQNSELEPSKHARQRVSNVRTKTRHVAV